MLPQNIKLWHIDYFELKKYEEKAGTGTGKIFQSFPEAGQKPLV